MSDIRTETRRQRYIKKMMSTAKEYPISVATVNFNSDENVGYLSRAAGCFGSRVVHVIGKVPNYKTLKRCSGTNGLFIDYIQHPDPVSFIQYCRENDIFILSAELHPSAISLNEFKFPKNRNIVCVIGNENTGVPAEILHRSDAIVEIPCPGFGYCLNAAMTGNIMLYTASQQLDPIDNE